MGKDTCVREAGDGMTKAAEHARPSGAKKCVWIVFLSAQQPFPQMSVLILRLYRSWGFSPGLAQPSPRQEKEEVQRLGQALFMWGRVVLVARKP